MSRTPESVVVSREVGKKKLTDLLLKCCTIRKITSTLYPTASERVIKHRYTLPVDVLSKLMGCCNELKEMWTDCNPGMLRVDMITITHTTS